MRISRDELVRALRCCADKSGHDKCSTCPYNEYKSTYEDGTTPNITKCTKLLARDTIRYVKYMENDERRLGIVVGNPIISRK